MPLNTVSMGQTHPTKKQTGSGQDWACIQIRRGEISQLGGRLFLCSQGFWQSNLVLCLVYPGGARTSPAVGTFGSRWVSLWRLASLRGGRVLERAIQHSQRVRWVGESTARKKAVCQDHVQVRVVALVGRQRLLDGGGAWVKAGHLKGSVVSVPHLPLGKLGKCGQGGPLSWLRFPSFPEQKGGGGGGVSKTQTNRDSRGGSYFRARGEIL